LTPASASAGTANTALNSWVGTPRSFGTSAATEALLHLAAECVGQLAEALDEVLLGHRR
jgi:hypothetical protein